MSQRYPPDYRGPRDRSRSPPRFDRDRRAATINNNNNNFDNRPPPPSRSATDAPRGPRIEPVRTASGIAGSPSNAGPRPAFSLRDAPPLGSGDRGRPFRERDDYRRERIPSPRDSRDYLPPRDLDLTRPPRPMSPRERSPPSRIMRDPRDYPPARDLDLSRPPRVPSPRERGERERSPPMRPYKDPRDYPPRDLDIPRARRGSRDGPLSAGSAFSDNPSFASAPFRGSSYSRGRGRGDSEYRGRGGRRNADDRDLFRQRSPPPSRWSRDPSREDREPDRRDERRFRDDDRRPDWAERDRDIDRRRDFAPQRMDSRSAIDSPTGSTSSHPPLPAPPIDPGRLAMIENPISETAAAIAARRPSMPHAPAPVRRDVPETPSYLNGRAELTANRYSQRGSTSPGQAPPVPAFTLSFAAPPGPAATQVTSAPASAPVPVSTSSPTVAPLPLPISSVPAVPASAPVPAQASTPVPTTAPAAVPKPAAPEPKPLTKVVEESQPSKVQKKPDTPPVVEAPPQPKPAVEISAVQRPPIQAPVAPRAQLNEPPPSAPRGPRAHEAESPGMHNRLQGVRSLESLQASFIPPTGPRANAPVRTLSNSQQTSVSATPALTQSVSPVIQPRPTELAAPTGPKAARASPSLATSPRPPFTSPRLDTGAFPAAQGFPVGRRPQTPPPSAPSIPNDRSHSMSPKVSNSLIPTAPKADRVPPSGPRGADRGSGPIRPAGPAARQIAPTAPKSLQQWNQWKHPRAFDPRVTPAKRDQNGEEKHHRLSHSGPLAGRPVDHTATKNSSETDATHPRSEDKMDIDEELNPPKHADIAQHSFFGQPNDVMDEDDADPAGDEIMSSSEEDDLDVEDEALFNAKFEKRRRELEAKRRDLSLHEFRATTPLESLARLARISLMDLERVSNEQKMEVDEAAAEPVPKPKPEPKAQRPKDTEQPVLRGTERTRKAAAAKPVEPPAEVKVEGPPRVRRPPPDPVHLPYLFKRTQDLAVREFSPESLVDEPDVNNAVFEDVMKEEDVQISLEKRFIEQYRKWRIECEKLDREQAQDGEREATAEPAAETEATGVIGNKRTYRFSSELTIAQVMKESEDLARKEMERQEQEQISRDAKRKLQLDLEKEAVLPDQMIDWQVQRSMFVDCNTYRDPKNLTLVFSYEPRPDTFTEQEQQIFIGAFRETPKKWGEIADLLPGRNYEDCIHHYYANKWDHRFRDKSKGKRGPGRGRGRGGRASGPRGRGSAAMADLSNTREDAPAAPTVMSDSGRPKRAAAPTTFGEREPDLKAAIVGPSPTKKTAASTKNEASGEAGPVPKRRKAEKTARKPKGQQPLAALAAAPAAAAAASSATPKPSFVPAPMPPAPTAEEMTRLEDASLLAGLHAGQHNVIQPPMDVQNHIVYNHHDGYVQPGMPVEDNSRIRPSVPTPPAKSSASSYWSVPEQTDFAKYIAHFGTDFASIAAHMGTKTQVMIKNHYQRQVEGGNKAELEASAKAADRRRNNGEELGAPPTPTPIVKRKYDAPQPTSGPRPLAPQRDGNAMEVDEPMQAAPPTQVQHQAQPPRVIPRKHSSPPQYNAQPRFPPTTQATPISGPLPTNGAPPMPQVVPHTPTPRSSQHPLGRAISFLPDNMTESRTSQQASNPGLRVVHEGGRMIAPPLAQLPPRTQPTQPFRASAASENHEMIIQGLKEEQERAFKVQQEQNQQERIGQIHRQGPLHSESTHPSPMLKPVAVPPMDRVLMKEEPSSSQRPIFGTPTMSRAQTSQPVFGSFGNMSFGSMNNRATFNPSPPKREEPRPSSVPAALPPVTQPAPAPEPPKRSNLMSILNSDPEPAPPQPTQPKREPLSMAPQRTHSPTQGYGIASTPASSAASMPGIASTRRDIYGQSSVPPSPFPSRPPFHRGSGPSALPQTPQPPQIKHDPSPSGQSNPSSSKSDWVQHVHMRSSQPPQPSPPALDGREMRSPFSVRPSTLASLNQPMRGNPSPPPPAMQPHMMNHSRTSSLNAPAAQSSRGQQQQPPPPQQSQHGQAPQQQSQHSYQQSRSGHGGQSQEHPTHQSSQQHMTQHGPHSTQPPTMFHPHAQAPNHGLSHHGHNSSIESGFAMPGHHRGASRDEQIRQDAFAAQREKERVEQEWIRRRNEENDHRREADRRDAMYRERHQQQAAQQQVHQQQQQQSQQSHPQQQFSRGPAPIMQSPFGNPAFGQTQQQAPPPPSQQQQPGSRPSLRDLSAREAESIMAENRMREREREEFHRRRQQEEAGFRRTPLSGGPGGYGTPPSGPPHPSSGRQGGR